MPVKEITIGADPEFGFMKRGAAVNAGSQGLGSGEFGADGGGGGPAELRPPPSSCPLGLVKNTRNVMLKGLEGNKNLKEFKWKAGSMAGSHAIGGHIHFGHPDIAASHSIKEDIGNMLNRSLGPLGVLIEDQEEGRRRRLGSGYGSIASRSWNPQEWGIEWRVLGSWLVSPRIAAGLLSIGYCLVHDYLNNKESREKMDKLPRLSPSDIAFPDRTALAAVLPKVILLLRGCERYKKYQRHIELILLMIANGKDWQCNRDMKKTWNLFDHKNVDDEGEPISKMPEATPVAVDTPPAEDRSPVGSIERTYRRDSSGRFA